MTGAPRVTRAMFSRQAEGGANARDRAQFLRFLAMGLVNTTFGYGMFAGLLVLGAGPLASLVGAAIAGATFTFQSSRLVVFRARGRLLRFVAVYGAVLALNWAALHAAATFGLPSLQAQALLTLPVATISFLGQRILVFGAVPA